MERKITTYLQKWKNDLVRKPLLIYGPKQVGKTFAILEFGEKEYKNVVYFNTDNNKELDDLFTKEKSPERIILSLSLLSGETILKDDTLIVLDNVDNLELINTRVENIRNERLNYYDVVTARAVTNMPVLTELAMPLVKINGYFIAMKGSNEKEIEDGKFAIIKMQGIVEEINKFSLSKEAGMRNIVKVKKEKETLNTELRPYEKIIKKPLAKN